MQDHVATTVADRQDDVPVEGVFRVDHARLYHAKRDKANEKSNFR